MNFLISNQVAAEATDRDIGLYVDLPRNILLCILEQLPHNVASTTGRLVCKDAHHHLQQATRVHVADPDLPMHALRWAFQHRFTTIRQRVQLLDSRAGAGDMDQVQWLCDVARLPEWWVQDRGACADPESESGLQKPVKPSCHLMQSSGECGRNSERIHRTNAMQIGGYHLHAIFLKT